MNNYRIDHTDLPCALTHLEMDSIKACDTCKELAEKVCSTLLLWRVWTEVREAIEEGDLAGRVTTLDLECVDGSFMTPANLSKLSTSETAQPVVFGYNEQEKTPFLVIRYRDVIHNKKAEIDPEAKSFLTVVLAPIPHVGTEQLMMENRFVKNGLAYAVEVETTFYLDGGRGVTDHVVKLIKGRLEGKAVL